MRRLAANRLCLPAGMAALLILALAYWWLDNGPHEFFGVVFFGLLTWHLFINRRWFLKLRIGRYDARRWIVAAIHTWLMINIGVLLITSAAVSHSIAGFFQYSVDASIVEFHWFSAYWVVMIIAVHVGTHWTRVMSSVATLFRLSPSRFRAGVLRLSALILLAFGAWSFAVLGVATKLMFGYSLDFWDFTASVTPFFAHWTAVMAGVAVLAHYSLTALRSAENYRSQSKVGQA
ncbi:MULTISPECIES: hypothetical protein [unclassified Rhizobium]|uniref:hypothetical protein n=1 Tax=unclassified Rhizobium TaxID=2613769 RepID=UPI000DD5D33A|nr:MULTISPECIES: hypothetical protein [unclassified Rhizobium]MBB3387244.1 hypothetical protein [Rhizobium sp. BK098]MBB3618949.1 hypothetical protein [Rhizobium sp. BK609]MBB3684605.1 hypothetical protein [Rhizobium sp. BK612]